MIALEIAVLAGASLAAVPAGVTAPLWWPRVRPWLPSLHRRAAHVVASAVLVAEVERAAHADAVRQRVVSRARRSYAAHAARPAAVAARARSRRRWA